jgi:hypothetical protein
MCSGHYRRLTDDEETLGTWSVELQDIHPVPETNFIVCRPPSISRSLHNFKFRHHNHCIQQSENKANFKHSLLKIGTHVICGYRNVQKKRNVSCALALVGSATWRSAQTRLWCSIYRKTRDLSDLQISVTRRKLKLYHCPEINKTFSSSIYDTGQAHKEGKT